MMASDTDDLKFCPKVELHAHLTGSVSRDTVTRLLMKVEDTRPRALPELLQLFEDQRNLNLDKAFDFFKLLHVLVDTLDTLETITCDVIEEFHDDRVQYLELRTTPKHMWGSYTKEEYLTTVLEAIIKCEQKFPITVRLLISVDRGRGVNDASENLNVCEKLMQKERYRSYIVGIDVSGNPKTGCLIEYVPVLEKARQLGLKLAVHLLEDDSEVSRKEARCLIDKGLVDRIGHGVFLHPRMGGDTELANRVLHLKIPIEICLTSNVKAGLVPDVNDHPLKEWWTENHPVVICTDDKGLFSTSLTEELKLAGKVLGIDRKSLAVLMANAIDCSFANETTRQEIKNKMLQAA